MEDTGRGATPGFYDYFFFFLFFERRFSSASLRMNSSLLALPFVFRFTIGQSSL